MGPRYITDHMQRRQLPTERPFSISRSHWMLKTNKSCFYFTIMREVCTILLLLTQFSIYHGLEITAGHAFNDYQDEEVTDDIQYELPLDYNSQTDISYVDSASDDEDVVILERKLDDDEEDYFSEDARELTEDDPLYNELINNEKPMEYTKIFLESVSLDYSPSQGKNEEKDFLQSLTGSLQDKQEYQEELSNKQESQDYVHDKAEDSVDDETENQSLETPDPGDFTLFSDDYKDGVEKRVTVAETPDPNDFVLVHDNGQQQKDLPIGNEEVENGVNNYSLEGFIGEDYKANDKSTVASEDDNFQKIIESTDTPEKKVTTPLQMDKIETPETVDTRCDLKMGSNCMLNIFFHLKNVYV